MIRLWKVLPITKGLLTWQPILNHWRLRQATTGGTDSARYCYSVWLRHLITLDLYGFKIHGAQVGELGPGDTVGVGLAALLSGASHYVGLDIVPFSAKADLRKIYNALIQMYQRKESIPDQCEFPGVRPLLESHEFPNHLIDWTKFNSRVERVRGELAKGINRGQVVSYRAPWTSLTDISIASLDLVFSQAVLEHVDALEETYRAMFLWLKPGGLGSHVIDFGAHHLSPAWNGHWAYRDWEWRLVRGRRECLLNREPLSTHLRLANRIGFEALLVRREYDSNGIDRRTFSQRFRDLDAEDVRTRGAMLILRKPRSSGDTSVP